MNQNKRLDNNFFIGMCAICIPFIGVILYLLKNRMTLSMVYPPMSDWNDELSYYKQIQGMVAYGVPQGYFGYNESSAAIGTFGPWSPVLLFPYFVFGKLFGWNYLTPIVANIILWGVTAFGFIHFVKPSRKQLVWVAVTFLAHATVTRYIFSVTPECIIMILVVWFFILVYASKNDDKKSMYFLVLANGVMFLLVTMRGYYALLGIILICQLLSKRRKIISIVLQVGAILVSTGVYVVILKKFTSPYFSPLVDMGWITEIFHTPIVGIKNFGAMLWAAFAQTISMMKAAVLVHDTVGCWYVIFFGIGVWIMYRSVCISKRYWIAFIIWIFMLLALWLLYDVRVGSRHLLAWGLFGILLIAYAEKSRIIKLTLICALIYLTWGSNDAYSYSLPRYDDNFATSLDRFEEMLEEKMPIHENPWDNTIIWALSVNYKDLYAIPTGYGVNICYDQYVIDNASSLKSKYVATSISSDLDAYAATLGWKEVALCNTTRIWEIQ